MIQQNTKNIKAVKLNNSTVEKVFLNQQRVFPTQQDQPVEPEKPIILSSIVLIEFNIFPGTDIPDEEFPMTMNFSNGHSYSVGRSFSTTIDVGHKDEDGNIIIDDYSWDSGSINITTATGKRGYGGSQWNGPTVSYYRIIEYTVNHVE